MLLKVVATKAATTIMETTILMVVEAVVVMLECCVWFLLINARKLNEVSNYELSWRKRGESGGDDNSYLNSFAFWLC